MADKEIILTDEQINAINHTHDEPAIVTAAAGSGKTTLLVDRVVRLLSDRKLGIQANELAIMTFTRNATKNMREKLSRKLTEKLETLADSDEDTSQEAYDYLKRQIFLLRQAAISTIDAFCLRMIKENAEAFDLPLNFTLADNARTAAMQSQAMKAALEELYSNSFSDAERDALFFSFSFEDDYKLEQALLSAADKLSCLPDPEKWMNDAPEAYKDIDALEANFLNLLDDFLELNVTKARVFFACYADENIYDEICEFVDEKRNADKPDTEKIEKMDLNVLPSIKGRIEAEEKLVEALVKDYDAYKTNKSIKALGELMANLEKNFSDLPKPEMTIGFKCPARSRFGTLKNNIAEAVEKLLECKVNFDDEQREIGFMQNALNTFFKLLRIYRENYEHEKRIAGCIDFSDCERELYNKLSENGGDNDFRKQLSQRFKCVIVDEFQDCNNIQARIFELLGEGRQFYVGDVKQSIYTFRGADPYIMAELCDNEDSGFKPLPLNTNFRSRQAVIDAVNAAFTGLMTPKFGGVDYANGNELHLGADYVDYSELKKPELYDTEITFIAPTAKESDDDDEKKMTLARYVAKRIRELVDDEDFLIDDGKNERDEHQLRRARYSDFIVLLRSNTKINNYRKALAELKIPSSSKSGKGFFETDEVRLAINYLKIIDNPLLDEEFLKVLMSPIYRFTADETAQIKMGLLGIEEKDEKKRQKIAESYKRRCSLFTCAKDCLTQEARVGKEKEEIKRTVSPKLERFFADLKAFRYHMTSSSLVDLVRKIYEDTDLISIVAAFEDSARRIGNIRQLQRMAAGFEARGGGGLGDFLRFLDRAAENDSKGVEEAAQPENAANAVRIMTFHASKGLEAPVCIMSELQKTMISDDYSGTMLLNHKHFLAMTHTDIKRRKKTKMLSYLALSRFIRDRELGDELRLLYVAMTRAQEKLIMVSEIGSDNYKKFDSYINNEKPDEIPELHDTIYEEAAPFKCVFKSLLRHAPTLEAGAKEFSFNNIACRVSALDPNAKPKAEDKGAVDETETECSPDPETKIPEQKIPDEKIAALSALIGKKYAHPEDTVQQAKFTTTELAHKKDAKPISLTKPSFARGGAVSGVEKGNAYHHCMQHFPLDSVSAEMDKDALLAAVRKALDEMERSRKITADERNIVEAERIAAFFENDLGKRMLRAYGIKNENVKREQSFYAEVKGSEVRQEYSGNISIQGQVDMYFIEDDDIVVVDYKSDTIENLAKEQSAYEFQVEIYTKVLGKLTGLKVKEMYLYAFLANSEYKIGK